MKTRINPSVVYSLALLVLLLTLTACPSHHPQPSQEDVFIKSASETWVLGTVTLDGKDVTSVFPNFALSFSSDKTYTSLNNPLHGVFAASGTYAPQSNANTSSSGLFDIVLDNATTLTVTSLAGTQLKFEFQYTGTGSRVTAVSGKYQFVMNVK